jgi:hypothetical protein
MFASVPAFRVFRMADNDPYSSPNLSKGDDASQTPGYDQSGGYQQPAQGYPTQGSSMQGFPAPGYDQQPSYPQQSYGPPPLPPTNAGWAVAAVIFFWPLAFAAFNHSSSVFPRWSLGDYQGAQYASDRTKQLGKYALWIFVAFFAIFIVFYIVIIAVAVSVGSSSTTF